MSRWNPFKSSQQKNPVIHRNNQTTNPLVPLNNIPEPTYEIYHSYRDNESLKMILFSKDKTIYGSKTIVDELDIKLLKSSDESIAPETNKKLKHILKRKKVQYNSNNNDSFLQTFTEQFPNVKTVFFVINTPPDLFTTIKVTLSRTEVYFDTDLETNEDDTLKKTSWTHHLKKIDSYDVKKTEGGSMKTSWSKRSDRKRSDRKRSDRKRSDRKRSDRKRRKTRRQTKSKRSNKTRK
jgi:hypothetical protein